MDPLFSWEILSSGMKATRHHNPGTEDGGSISVQSVIPVVILSMTWKRMFDPTVLQLIPWCTGIC